MKNAVSYVSSFIVSILLIFLTLVSLICLTVRSYTNPQKIKQIVQKQNISHIVYTELEKYYSERYNNTGIPADIYMNAIDEEYLNNLIMNKIGEGFAVLNITSNPTTYEPLEPRNEKLDTALSNFYSDYADSIGAEKDAKYDEKLSDAKENAYKIIVEYCDIYKISAMIKHGILTKLSPVYTKLPMITGISLISVAVLLLILFLINLKSKSVFLYWAGISAIISGIIGAVPCIWLKATDFFSAFTVKQAQIYTAYTSTMNDITQNFMTASIITASTGAVLVIIYAVLGKILKD